MDLLTGQQIDALDQVDKCGVQFLMTDRLMVDLLATGHGSSGCILEVLAAAGTGDMATLSEDLAGYSPEMTSLVLMRVTTPCAGARVSGFKDSMNLLCWKLQEPDSCSSLVLHSGAIEFPPFQNLLRW